MNRARKDGRSIYCKPCHRAKSLKWHKENPEYLLKWKERQAHMQPTYASRYHAKHKEKRNQYNAEWVRLNPEKHRAKEAKRRALKQGYSGQHYSDVDLAACLTAQDGYCWYCGFKLPVTVHVDHVVPLSKGGGNGPDNVVLACPPCNGSKGKKLLGLEWVPPIVRILGTFST